MATQPNLLIFITDQQRSDTMACYGNDWIQAPHLNALAKESFVFENTYCAQPVCTPARATLLTGLYPHTAGMIKNNVQLDPAIQSIAEMVSDDYHCAYYGKWHLGNETTCQHGFDEWLPIFELPWVIDHPDTPYHQFLLQNDIEPDRTTAAGHRVFSAQFRSNLPEELTHVSYLADEAARFLKSRQHEPFMLQVHCPEPHGPYTGPLNDVHNPDELPVGPTFLEFPEGASLFNRKRAEYYLHADGHKMGKYGPGTSEQQWRRFRAQYY
ncbi:MAG: sulfatase-like hydrolase/transferase, partial [bacterium]|nr:sulfatase-like hydrolase/transferase [bacterium]